MLTRILTIAIAYLSFLLPGLAQSNEGPIRLIVRSDDLGATHATNVGILESYKNGITTSVEVMVPTPWFPEAVKMLKENPGLDVGVHLVLTSEWSNIKWRPLTQVPSITDDWGYFYPMVWPNAHFPTKSAILEQDWKIDEIEKELRAQIELAKREIPQLSHLSGHMGCLNINDETKALFQELAKDYDLDIHPADHQVQQFRGFGGAHLTAEQKIENFVQALEKLGPGIWMVVAHPALGTLEQTAISHPGYDAVGFDRDGVMKALMDARVKEVIERRKIELISYADLK